MSVPSADTGMPVAVFLGGPDPRPVVVAGERGFVVSGLRCTACAYPTATRVPWCPRCHGQMEDAALGPCGEIWSATVIRVPVPNRTSPYVIAYVDLDGGTRVLAHLPSVQEPPPVGGHVRLCASADNGDVQVEPVR